MKEGFRIHIYQQVFMQRSEVLSNLRLQAQEEITRIKNRIARWFSIYFPEIKDVYKNPGCCEWSYDLEGSTVTDKIS